MSKAKWFQFCAIVVMLVAAGAYASGTCKKCDGNACAPAQHMESGRMICSETDTGATQACQEEAWRSDSPPSECGYCWGVLWGHYPPEACPQSCYTMVASTCPVYACELSGSHCSTYDPPPEEETPGSPAVFKVENGPWEISTAANGVPFDLAGEGEVRHWSWPEQDSGIDFLVLDRGVPDGKVTSGRELFGDATLLRSGARAAHAFEALAELDDNGDRFIDAFDAAYPYLQFWRDDAPRDGVSQSHELTPIASHGVEWISVDYIAEKARVDQNGNAFRFMSHAKINGHVVVFYDVFLKSEAITP